MWRRARAQHKSILFVLGCVLMVFLVACQERAERTVSLTQEQWKVVKKNVLDEAPEMDVKVGAVFGHDGTELFELVGYSLKPSALVTGQSFALTWYWKSLNTSDTNWKIFVHLNAISGSGFQNLDHHPVENLYQTSQWQPGKIVVDAQNDKLNAGFPSSGARLSVGFWDERTGKRLDVMKPGIGSVPEPGKLLIGDLSTKNDKELTAYKVAQPPTVDGNLNDPAWRVAERTKAFVHAVNGQTVGFSTTARVVYTDEALYFAFDARDKDIRTTWRNRDDKLWQQDCVEIYLNPDNDNGTYWELQISPGESAGKDGTPIFDAYFETKRKPAWELSKNENVAGMVTAVKRNGTLNSPDKQLNDTGYTLEVKIPFADLTNTESLKRIKMANTPPKEGDTWRMNFFRVDFNEPQGKAETKHAAWSPSGGDFHNLDAFGTLKFGPIKDPNNRKGASGQTPKVAGKERLVTTVVRVQNVQASAIGAAARAASGKLLDCLKADGATPPTVKTSYRFEVTLDEKGAITHILRPTDTGTHVDSIECMVTEIEGWQSIKLREPKNIKPGETAKYMYALRAVYYPPGTGSNLRNPDGYKRPNPSATKPVQPNGVQPSPVPGKPSPQTGTVDPAPSAVPTPSPTPKITEPERGEVEGVKGTTAPPESASEGTNTIPTTESSKPGN